MNSLKFTLFILFLTSAISQDKSFQYDTHVDESPFFEFNR